MGIIWYPAILAAVIPTSWIVTAHVNPPDRAVRALVAIVLFHFFTVMAVQLIAAAELIGIIGSVDLVSVAAAAGLLLLAAAGLCLGMRGTARPNAAREPAKPGKPIPKYVVLIGVIVLVSWLSFAIDAATSFDFGWDALAYHLPVAVRWLQASSLAIPDLTGWQNGLPSNGELGAFLLLSAGLQRVAFLYNWLAAAGGMLAVYVLARRITANFEAAVLSAALFATIPAVQNQASSGYIDLYGACFILAGIALFFERDHVGAQDGRRWYLHALLLAGIACGIGIGTKPVYYAYGAVCGLGAAILIWRDRGSRLGPALALSTLLAACMLVPSAFWFLRALEATGNPFYPIAVTVLGVPVFDGFDLDRITHGPVLDRLFVGSAWQWLIYPWIETKSAGPPYGTGSGLGAVWATLVPIGLVFATVTALRGPRGERSRTLLTLLVLFAAMAGLWWFGLRRLPRFGLAFVILSCALTAPLIAYLITRHRGPAQLLLAAAFATSAVLSTFSPLHGILGRVRANEWSRAAAFEIPAVIDNLPDGAVVWNAGGGETMNFALFGAQLTNRVLTGEWRTTEGSADYIRRNRVEYLVDRAPYCCGEVESLDAELIFEGRIGPTFDWRVWKLPEPKD